MMNGQVENIEIQFMEMIKKVQVSELEKLLQNQSISQDLLTQGMMIACEDFAFMTQDYENLILYLISKGANINARRKSDGMSVLSIACKKAVPHLVETFLNNKVDLEIKDNQGKTCLFYAIQSDYSMSFQILSLLLEHGVNVDIIDNQGESPLSLALKKNLIKCSAAILKKVKNLDYKDSINGNSYLHLAVLTQNENIVNAVLKKGIQNNSNFNNKKQIPSEFTNNQKLLTALAKKYDVKISNNKNQKKTKKKQKSKEKKKKHPKKKTQAEFEDEKKITPKQKNQSDTKSMKIIYPKKSQFKDEQQEIENLKLKHQILLQQLEDVQQENYKLRQENQERESISIQDTKDDNKSLFSERNQQPQNFESNIFMDSIGSIDDESDQNNEDFCEGCQQIFNINVDYSNQNLEQILHDEILQFQNQIDFKTEQIQTTIHQLMTELQNLISIQLKSDFRLHIYGSYANGLNLPSSDIDILIQVQPMMDPKLCLELVEKGLKTSPNFEEVTFIRTATIPVIKIQTKDHYQKIKVDITYLDLGHYGLQCVNYVKKLIIFYKPLKPIVLVLKQLLSKTELNDPYHGGLTSYGLILMVIAFFQKLKLMHQYDKIQNQYGRLLIEFLRFFSTKFQYTTMRIAPQNVELVQQDPFPPIINQGFGQHNQKQLIIQDPLNPYNNVSQSTYNVVLINIIFTCAFNAITQVCNCEIKQLHDKIAKKIDNFNKEEQIILCVEKNSLLEKLFNSNENLLFQITKENVNQLLDIRPLKFLLFIEYQIIIQIIMEQLKQNIENHLNINQNKVSFEDYNILQTIILKTKTQRKSSLIEGNRSQSTLTMNIKFQQKIFQQDEQIKNLKEKVDFYKEKYIFNKQALDEETKKYIELDSRYNKKLKELKQVTEQRNRMENEIIEMKLKLQKQIEQFDEQIIEYKKFNQEQKKQITQIKFQKNLLRKQIYQIQSQQQQYEDKTQSSKQQGDFLVIDDFDFQYKKLSELNNTFLPSVLENYNSEYFVTNINPKNNILATYCGCSFTHVSIQQNKFNILNRLELQSPIITSCFDQNGEFLLQSNQQPQLVLFDSQKLVKKTQINLKNPANFLQFISKNTFILIDNQNNLQLWDLNKQVIKQQKSFDYFSQVTSLTTDQNNNIFIGFSNGTYQIIDQHNFILKDNYEIWHDGSVGQIEKIDDNMISSICLNKQIYFTDIRKNGVQNLIDLSFMNFQQKKFHFKTGNYKQIIGTEKGEIKSFDITKNFCQDQTLKVCDNPIPYIYYNEPLDQIYAMDTKGILHFIHSDIIKEQLI